VRYGLLFVTPDKADRRRKVETALLVIGVAALGYNLRGAITSLPPLFPELTSRLHLSAATVSVLAAVPVICFGVVSGFAAWFSRRLGEERVLGIAVVTLMAGLLLRAAAPHILLFPGTTLAAAAIAVMNVLLSSLIKRRWPERAGLLVGVYITALSLGAIVGSLAAVPLWNATGGSVPLALGWLAAPAALAAAVWLPQFRYRTDHGASPVLRGLPVFRHALAWQVTLFMGTQSLLYYATLSWLPSILRDRGVSPEGAGDRDSNLARGRVHSGAPDIRRARVSGRLGMTKTERGALRASMARVSHGPGSSRRSTTISSARPVTEGCTPSASNFPRPIRTAISGNAPEPGDTTPTVPDAARRASSGARSAGLEPVLSTDCEPWV